ncbi:MAG: bifunctional pyr operon transcriptional regulator/uracil phosphoribosyltransferase PyrR [Clostridia bacterium]
MRQGPEPGRMILDAEAVNRALRRIAHEIVERNRGVEGVILLGIARRGEPLAARLGRLLTDIEHPSQPVPVYSLDIGPYRDDREATERPGLPFSSDNRVVVIVDDVIWTGRSVRAAMDAVTAAGRARRIEVAVLVDRGHRELPIRPDFVGKNIPTAHDEYVHVNLAELDGGADAVLVLRGGSRA